MTLSSIGSTSASPSASYQSGLQQRSSEFRQLSQALQSGDLSAAQKAYSALTQDAKSQNAQSDQNSPLAQDFAALGKALQSGDLAGAQQAFSKLQKDATSSTSSSQASGTRRGHHRHHHVGSTSAATTASTDGTQATTGTIINVTG